MVSNVYCIQQFLQAGYNLKLLVCELPQYVVFCLRCVTVCFDVYDIFIMNEYMGHRLQDGIYPQQLL